MKKSSQSFRSQMSQSMAELQSIMDASQSPTGNGRFTARDIQVREPTSYSALRIRAVRKRLGVSQIIFAELLGVSQVLVRSWERSARKPSPLACRLLDLVRRDPDALKSLIYSGKHRRARAA